MNLFQQDVPLAWYLLLSAALFSLGVVGFLITLGWLMLAN